MVEAINLLMRPSQNACPAVRPTWSGHGTTKWSDLVIDESKVDCTMDGRYPGSPGCSHPTQLVQLCNPWLLDGDFTHPQQEACGGVGQTGVSYAIVVPNT